MPAGDGEGFTLLRSSSSKGSQNEEIVKYWGTLDAATHAAPGASACASRRSQGSFSFSPSMKGVASVSDLDELKVFNKLDIAFWLYDPNANANVWGNDCALELYGLEMEDFTAAGMMDPGGSPREGRGGRGAASGFFERARRVTLDPSAPSRQASKGGEGEGVAGEGGAGEEGDEPETSCAVCDVLPGLSEDSDCFGQLFQLTCRPFRLGMTPRASLRGAEPGGGEARTLCLVQASPASIFNTAVKESLRALAMMKSSPIFTFLFSRQNYELLMANPRGVEYYQRRVGDPRGISMPSILTLGKWEAVTSLMFPDDDQPPEGIHSDLPLPVRMGQLCDHIGEQLFGEDKRESFRIHLQMPRRSSPGQHRWVEFEFWAIEDPVTGAPAILVNQTNLQETKKKEMTMTQRQAELQSHNKQLRVELERAKLRDSRSIKLDLESTVDKTVSLLQGLLGGRQPTQGEVQALKKSLLQSKNLRQPAHLEEMLLTDREGFGGDVGLSLFEMLKGGDGTKKVKGEDALNSSRSEPYSFSSRGQSLNLSLTASGSGSAPLDKSMLQKAMSGREGDFERNVAMNVRARLEASAPLQECLENVDNFFFDVFELDRVSNGHSLAVLSLHIMTQLGLLETYCMDPLDVFTFLMEVERGYPNNAYHNGTHAANVVQSMYIMITRGMGPGFVGDLEILAGLLSAILHDFEHKGVNNEFLVRFQDELAMTYNDRSPQENHHVSAGFQMMLKPEYKLFQGLTVEQYTKMRKLIIEMVLATDMKRHFDILGRFKVIESKTSRWYSLMNEEYQDMQEGKLRHCESSGSRSSEDDMAPTSEDISLVMQLALKCADIGHVYCTPKCHLKWVQRLEQELFTQGDKEKDLGLEQTSPLMDRDKAGITKSQQGFFQIVVMPMFTSFAASFPAVQPLLESIRNNLDLWRSVEEEELEISEVFSLQAE